MEVLLESGPGRLTVVETMKSVCHSERRSKSRYCVDLFELQTIHKVYSGRQVCTTSRTFSGGALMMIVVSSVALNQDVMLGGS
jgi:hypothetical protein